ncbi:hypothetical protein [Novosphingobium sp. SG707]|uniref:hypothetical protein n=1 Tax=Novosphingobium sp. SG707 TaxID=2586996 RepID=UPI001836DF9C|nr:hypothetical protein [Novosphingobium sp. SG707]NKI98756.1 hypothetical protein [Novosphingobium sp. SG707]
MTQTPSNRGRILAGFTLALAIALSAYILINAAKADSVGFASLWFLAILPAYLCALICYVADPGFERPRSFYLSVPPVFGALVCLGSAVFLREGVICLVMLAPIWLSFGWLGVYILRRWRKGRDDPARFRASLLFLPLLCGGMESQIPVIDKPVTLTRSIVIGATPEQIWPYAVANAHIGPDEGQWNFTQSILRLPRPRATTLQGQGVGAIRTAYWGDHINFEERITQWQPGRRLGWAFAFTNSSLQDYTDRHIAPDGPFLKIDTGDYTLTPLDADRTLLTLRTNYIAKTHVNPYAQLWGEILLGDIQSNILAIIKQRAEGRVGKGNRAFRMNERPGGTMVWSRGDQPVPDRPWDRGDIVISLFV